MARKLGTKPRAAKSLEIDAPCRLSRSYRVRAAEGRWVCDYYKGEEDSLFNRNRSKPFTHQWFDDEKRAHKSGALWVREGRNLPTKGRG